LGFVNYGTFTGTGLDNKVTTDETNLAGIMFKKTAGIHDIGLIDTTNVDYLRLSPTNSGFTTDGSKIEMFSNIYGQADLNLIGGNGSNKGDVNLTTSSTKSVKVTNTDNSTSETTGALVVAGGIGVAKDVVIKGILDLNTQGGLIQIANNVATSNGGAVAGGSASCGLLTITSLAILSIPISTTACTANSMVFVTAQGVNSATTHAWVETRGAGVFEIGCQSCTFIHWLIINPS